MVPHLIEIKHQYILWIKTVSCHWLISVATAPNVSHIYHNYTQYPHIHSDNHSGKSRCYGDISPGGFDNGTFRYNCYPTSQVHTLQRQYTVWKDSSIEHRASRSDHNTEMKYKTLSQICAHLWQESIDGKFHYYADSIYTEILLTLFTMNTLILT